MENRILVGTKKALGLAEAYTAFDEDILMHINSTFSVLTQLGVGPEAGFSISDSTAVWSDFISEDSELYSMVRSYMFLKVRLLFDPPVTSFTIDAFKKQAEEYEYRMNAIREKAIIDAQSV